MDRVKEIIHKLQYYYPFTLPGTVLAGVLVYILGISYAYKNPFGLFIAIVGLVMMILLALLSRLQANRFEKLSISWESHEPLYAARGGSHQKVVVPQRSAYFFFRIHFIIAGRFQVGRERSLWYYREQSFPGNGTLEMGLLFPMCGLFHAQGTFAIKDVFGLSRARFLPVMKRQLPVQPSLLGERKRIAVQVTGGEDSKQKKKTSDEEKYYMREYIPGDKFRDINWKATSRLDEIFTRVSPATEEKIRIIYVDFRHFAGDSEETLQSVYHLHYIKSWLISFLWNTKRDYPEYQFHVATGEGAVLLETEDDIQRFSMTIPGMFYMHEPAMLRDPSGVDRLFVFSTPFDRGLTGYLRQYGGVPVTLFRTRIPRDSGQQGQEIRFFTLPMHPLVPAPWLLKREQEVKNPGVAGTVENTEEETLAVRLV
jgi:hypothetical protein